MADGGWRLVGEWRQWLFLPIGLCKFVATPHLALSSPRGLVKRYGIWDDAMNFSFVLLSDQSSCQVAYILYHINLSWHTTPVSAESSQTLGSNRFRLEIDAYIL